MTAPVTQSAYCLAVAMLGAGLPSGIQARVGPRSNEASWRQFIEGNGSIPEQTTQLSR